jgi:transcription initiation factor IIF auxiliary subunit
LAIRLNNTSKYIGQEGQTSWWDWTVFIEADKKAELDDVAHVIYTLHRTFHDPVVKVTERKHGFPLTRRGWGTFRVQAKIEFKSGKSPLILYHQLKFDTSIRPAPSKD